MLNMIWAQGENGVIGDNNSLIWHFSSDMKHFRETTKNSIVVMGYNTFESLGFKGLPKRENYVLTRSHEINDESIHSINDFNKILELAKEHEVFIIGGSQIYNLFFPYADKLIITMINESYNGDTSIPEFNLKEFNQTKKESIEEKGVILDFITYERISD